MRRARLACLCVLLIPVWLAHGASTQTGASGEKSVDAALNSALAAQRESALDRIIETQDSRPALTSRLAQLLDDQDLDVAGKAATALSMRGAEAFPAIDQLLQTG